jgi:hypothetical protein
VSIPGSANPLFTEVAVIDEGYQISRSLRFSSGDTPYLSRDPSKDGGKKNWTWAFWVKRGEIPDESSIISSESGTKSEFARFNTDGTFQAGRYNGSSYDWRIITNALYRDGAAFYHCCIAYDSDQGTASNRVKLFINGKKVTSFSTADYPAQHSQSYVNDSGYDMYIGKTNQGYMDGYLSDIYWVDGYTATETNGILDDFGTIDADTGAWTPAELGSGKWPDRTRSTELLYGVNTSDNGFDTSNTSRSYDATGHSYSTFTTPQSANQGGQGANAAHVYKSPDGTSITWAVQTNTSDRYIWLSNDGQNWTQSGSYYDTDGGSPVNVTSPWICLCAGSNASNVTVTTTTSGYGDTPKGWNNCKVNFSDDSTNSRLGYDFGPNGKIEDATGALPIRATTDEWGAVKDGSSLRADSSAGTTDGAGLVLAIPGDVLTNYASFADGLVIDPGEAFNGSTSGSYASAASNKTGTFTFTGSKFTGITKLRIYGRYDSRDSAANAKILVNDADIEAGSSAGWVTATEHLNSGALNTLKIVSSSYNTAVWAIEIDDVIVVSGDDADVHASINTGSSKNNVVPKSGPKVSTKEPRFYGTSLEFDGSADRLDIASSADFNLHGGNWCVEGWFYSINDTGAQQILIENGTAGTTGWSISRGTNRKLYFYAGGTEAMGGAHSILTPDNEWYHVALVRNGSTTTFYVNGEALQTTATDAANGVDGVWIGLRSNGSLGFKGYINDIRIYKSQAKYTANFFPPERTNWNVTNLVAGGSFPVAATVATATGALPFYNTSGDYGTVQETGERSDSSAGTTNGTGLIYALGDGVSDVHASVNTGSGNKTFGNNGVTTTTSNTKFYGTAISFDGSNDYMNMASNATDNADFDFGSGDFTCEAWVRSSSTNQQSIISKFNNASNWHWNWMLMNGGHKFQYSDTNGSGSPASYQIVSTALVCDGNWHHVAAVRKSGTIYLFTDGFISASATGHNRTISSGGEDVAVGRDNSNSGRFYFDGLMTDVRVYKAVAKYDSTFNPPSATAPNLGADSDSLRDSPTNKLSSGDQGNGGEINSNYCVLNPLAKSSILTLSQGNLKITSSGTTGRVFGTVGVSSGKWYYEYTTNETTVGLGISAGNNFDRPPGGDAISYAFIVAGGNPYKQTDSAETSYGSVPAVGDVIGCAFDLDAGTITMYKNGVSMGQMYSGITAGTYLPVVGDPTSTANISGNVNFGQRPFSHPVANHKCLCTSQLVSKDQTIKKGTEYFDTTVWIGDNNATRTITGLDFQPGMILGRQRNDTRYWQLYDAVRGTAANKDLITNNDKAEGADDDTAVYGYISAFTSDGFTATKGSSAGAGNNYWNANSQSYMAHLWKTGTTSGISGGTITPSSYSFNSASGVSILKYTGNGSNGATVPHGLGKKPSMIWIKRLDADDHWLVYHQALSAERYIYLNTDGGSGDDASKFNDTEPTNSVFSLGTDGVCNANNGNYVAYCFSEVMGFSRFGSAVGNGNVEGPFCYCGFTPTWVLWKWEGGTADWGILDTTRSPENVINDVVFADLWNAEDSNNANWARDYVSNGFKIRGSHSAVNNSGGTHIWAAFASNPFSLARAR